MIQMDKTIRRRTRPDNIWAAIEDFGEGGSDPAYLTACLIYACKKIGRHRLSSSGAFPAQPLKTGLRQATQRMKLAKSEFNLPARDTRKILDGILLSDDLKIEFKGTRLAFYQVIVEATRMLVHYDWRTQLESRDYAADDRLDLSITAFSIYYDVQERINILRGKKPEPRLELA